MTFLRNIGADLVEKRLWPVAAALIVALVAVPTLLASPAKEPANEGPSAAVARAAARAPKVVTLNTEPVGRRNRGGSSKNPFKQLFVPKLADVTVGAAQAPAAADDAPKSDNTGGTGGDNSTPKTPTSDNPTPKASTEVYRVTLRFGQPGALSTIADIPRLTPLPSIEDPFFVFLGVKEDGKTLVFLVSSDAKATGDGKCQPQDSCETIEMQAGDTEFFDLTTDAGQQQFQMDIVKISKVKAASAKAARKARARHSRVGAALLTLAQEDATTPDLLGGYRWDPKRGVLDVVKHKASAAKVAVGPVAGTAAVTP